MEDLIILIIIITIALTTLLGMIKGKLLLFNGRLFVSSERMTGWRAIFYGIAFEIILGVVAFIWISNGEIEFTRLQLIISVIISAILSPFLYMFLHMVEEKKSKL